MPDESVPEDSLAILARQRDHQFQLARRRWMWIPWVFRAGFLLAALGVVGTILDYREQGSPIVRLVFMGFFFAWFGWVVVSWQVLPYRLTLRIVPCFSREVSPYGGPSSTAFPRGCALAREILALDAIADAAGVRRLATFGFADDHFDQAITWHPVAEGLATVDALRSGLDARLTGMPEVAADLDALAVSLRAAAEAGVEFCLILRLQKKDSLQAVMSMEEREGRFW